MLLSSADEILVGGSRGGGKTDAGIAWMIHDPDDESPYLHPKYRGLVLRKNFTDARDWIDRAMYMYRGLGAKLLNGDEIHFPSGAKIIVGHLSSKDAFQKYQGHEYQRMLFEELTHIPTEELYLKVLASNRSTISVKPKSFATTNPGGPGHSWVKKRFIDPAKPGSIFRDQVSGKTRVFIPATVEDNPTIMKKDPAYVKYLDSLPPDLRDQWRYGIWDAVKVKGAYYTDDILQAQEEDRIGKMPFYRDKEVHTIWDLGINDTQVCLFFQVVGQTINFIDSFDETDKGYDYYIAMLDEKKYRYGKICLPHDGSKRSNSNLVSFKDALERAGHDVVVLNRPKDKLSIINSARSVFPNCYFDAEKMSTLVDALTSYRREWDELHGIFKPTPKHDWSSHWADAFGLLPKAIAEISVKSADEDYFAAAHKYINANPYA